MKRYKVKFEEINGTIFDIDVNECGEEGRNVDKIISFLKDEKAKKKLRHIIELISKGEKNNNVYGPENFNESIKNITAIKFKGKKFNNARIYCQDNEGDTPRVIVLCELHRSKKQDKLTEKERNIITRINDYDYEYE